jgi:glycerophosphoryl diester phosphodiesterase
VADGVDALFSDDPVYVAGDAGRRTSDLFARQVWLPGMLPDTDRGRFHPDDASWGCGAPGTTTCTLMGFLAPPDPAAFTLSLDLRVDAPDADARACSGWVLLSTDDHPYRPPSGPSPGVDGYCAGLRGDGGLDVHRVTDGVPTPLASSAPGTALRTRAWVPLRIAVTGSALSVTRADADGGTLSVVDTTHRPVPVVHLGGTSAAVRFRDLVLT